MELLGVGCLVPFGEESFEEMLRIVNVAHSGSEKMMTLSTQRPLSSENISLTNF